MENKKPIGVVGMIGIAMKYMAYATLALEVLTLLQTRIAEMDAAAEKKENVNNA